MADSKSCQYSKSGWKIYWRFSSRKSNMASCECEVLSSWWLVHVLCGVNNSWLPLLNPYGKPNPVTVAASKSFSPAQGLQYSPVLPISSRSQVCFISVHTPHYEPLCAVVELSPHYEPLCAVPWRLLPGYQGDLIKAQERIKVGCPSCHHHWLFWDSNPRLAARKSCILTTEPPPLPQPCLESLKNKN